jgi:hypothetical protein
MPPELKMPPVGRRTTCALPQELQPPPSESSSSSDDDDADVPPPEIVNLPTAKLLDSLSRMVRSRWGTLRRHNPELQFPLALLDGADISWTVKVAPERHSRHGRLNLARLADAENHQRSAGGSLMIDSPRSVVVLLRNGFSADSMRADAADAITTSRRLRSLQSLTSEYNALTRDVSSAFVVSVFRGEVDPMNHLAVPPGSVPASGNASPASSRSPRNKSPPVEAKPVGVPSPTRCKPQDLKRLQRHRSAFTTEWGAKQQAIATETFVTQRVTELVVQHKSEVRKRAQQFLEKGSQLPPASSSTPPPSSGPRALRSSDASEYHDDAGLAATTSAPSAATTHSPLPAPDAHRRAATPDVSKQPKRLGTAMSRANHVRQERDAIEERRRAQVEATLMAKERRAADAAQKHRDQRREAQLQQRARAKEVQDVVGRMERAADVRRLQVIKAVEEDADARAKRRDELRHARRERQLATKLRTTLQHRTRDFVDKAATAVEKATALQEMAVSAPIDVQRALKAESRSKLLRLLDEEDRLLRTWSHLEQKSEAGALSQPPAHHPTASEGSGSP